MNIVRELVLVAKDMLADEGLFAVMGRIAKDMRVNIETPDEGRVLFIGGKHHDGPTVFWPQRSSVLAMLVQSVRVFPKRPDWKAEVLPGARFQIEVGITMCGGHMGETIVLPLILGDEPEKDIERFLSVEMPMQVSHFLKARGKELIETKDSISKSISDMYDSGRYMGD